MLGTSSQIGFDVPLDLKAERGESPEPIDDLLLDSTRFRPPWEKDTGPARKDDRLHAEARAQSWLMLGD